MEHFDSFLYGNGLTLHIFQQINERVVEKNKAFLYADQFVNYFLNLPIHSKLHRIYNTYFTMDHDVASNHRIAQNYIKSNIADIHKYGFEHWLGQKTFGNNIEEQQAMTYLYLLYNYWYRLCYERILSYETQFLKQYSDTILKQLSNPSNIFTTNFDTILDEYIKPKHIHGQFKLSVMKASEIVCPFNSRENGYYYLFGSNGYNKLHILNQHSLKKTPTYDFSFFYDRNLFLGHLYIFGLSLSNSTIIPKELMTKKPEYKNFLLLNIIDGHIITQLKNMYKLKKLKKITISYYSEADKTHLLEIFKKSALKKILVLESTSISRVCRVI